MLLPSTLVNLLIENYSNALSRTQCFGFGLDLDPVESMDLGQDLRAGSTPRQAEIVHKYEKLSNFMVEELGFLQCSGSVIFWYGYGSSSGYCSFRHKEVTKQ
jgi:hypothetical protein